MHYSSQSVAFGEIFLPRIILPIKLLVQRAQTGRRKFISNINDHLGLKPAVSIVTIGKGKRVWLNNT